MNESAVKAYKLRQDIVDIIVAGGGGHIGGDMSSVEIMLALYNRMNVDPANPDDPDRDRFVLSKGHCVETLYAVLADKGFLDLEEVKAKLGTEDDPSEEQIEEILKQVVADTNERLENYKKIKKTVLRMTEFEKNTSKKIKRY